MNELVFRYNADKTDSQGCRICPEIGSDWPKNGQICDFLRSVSQNVPKLILKSLRFAPLGQFELILCEP